MRACVRACVRKCVCVCVHAEVVTDDKHENNKTVLSLVLSLCLPVCVSVSLALSLLFFLYLIAISPVPLFLFLPSLPLCSLSVHLIYFVLPLPPSHSCFLSLVFLFFPNLSTLMCQLRAPCINNCELLTDGSASEQNNQSFNYTCSLSFVQFYLSACRSIPGS